MSLLTQLVNGRGGIPAQLCLPRRPGVTYGPDMWEYHQSPPCFYAFPEAIFIILIMYSRISVLSLGTSWELPGSLSFSHGAEDMFAEGRDRGGQSTSGATHTSVILITIQTLNKALVGGQKDFNCSSSDGLKGLLVAPGHSRVLKKLQLVA